MVGRAENRDPGLPLPDQALSLAAAEAQRETEAHLAEDEQEVDEHRRAVEKAARDRHGWRRKVADLEQQLGYARQEAEKAEHRVADAKEVLGLAEQRLRAAQVSLDK
jgi:chromosome segregation ATPase